MSKPNKISDGQRMNCGIRKPAPCKDCTERDYPSCYSDCPKDKRGEYGYKAWTAEKDAIKEKKRKYTANRCVRRYYVWRAKEFDKKYGK